MSVSKNNQYNTSSESSFHCQGPGNGIMFSERKRPFVMDLRPRQTILSVIVHLSALQTTKTTLIAARPAEQLSQMCFASPPTIGKMFFPQQVAEFMFIS